MVGIIICEVNTIMCDIGTINVRFYLLEVQYPHEYCRITQKYNSCTVLYMQNNKFFN